MATDIGATTTWQARVDAQRGEWFRNGVIAGVTATLAMTATIALAYWTTKALGNADGG